MNVSGRATCCIKRQAKGNRSSGITHILVGNSGVSCPSLTVVANDYINYQSPTGLIASHKTGSRTAARVITADSISTDVLKSFIPSYCVLACVSIDKRRTITAHVKR